MGDFGCKDHHEEFAPHVHMDGGHHNNTHLHDHQRGAGHPAHHTKGKMPSQLNPDHGPHHMHARGHGSGGHPPDEPHLLRAGHPHVGGHGGGGRHRAGPS